MAKLHNALATTELHNPKGIGVESATLEVSEKGLSRINFKVDQYDVTYYLVAVQDVD